MKFGSIRLRLAAWYLIVLGVGMALFAMSIFVAVRYELMEGADESLIARLHSFELFLELESHGSDLSALREEAREYSTGLPVGHRLRVRTSDGMVLFASSEASDESRDLYWIAEQVNVHGHDLRIEMAAPLGQVYETLSLLRNALLFCVPLMLAVATVGGAWIAKRALAPVDAMTADAQAIGMHDLSRRLVVRPTSDELERLGVAWNTMLDRLEDSVQQMKRFTADAAHELRTPIAIIRSTAELALRRERDSASYRNALSGILQETIHLTRLVEELLWLARYDADSPVMDREDIAVEEAVRDACHAVMPIAQERGIHLEIRSEQRGSTIRVNRLAFRRVLLILLDNALKFTPAAESVTVVVGSRGSRPRIEIHDRGGGVAEEHIEHIFDRFYRADTARTSTGFGLGLSIAKTIVEAHNGEIGIASTNNYGSCFFVELPSSLAGTRSGVPV
jgi:two-component system, OmpR family, heavy metal sensor histidine kinase CusS